METVVIVVGTGAKIKSFKIHKTLLCAKVTFFDKMFNGPFSEASTQTASLTDEEVASFKLFLGWLYQDRIPVPPSFAQCGMGEIEQLCRLFALAEKYNVTLLADQTMDFMTAFMKKRCWTLSSVLIGTCYEITHQSSKLRIFACRFHVYQTLHYPSDATGTARVTWSNREMLKVLKNSDDLFADFYGMLRLQAGKSRVDPRYELPCDYHQHGKNEMCPYITAAKK